MTAEHPRVGVVVSGKPLPVLTVLPCVAMCPDGGLLTFQGGARAAASAVTADANQVRNKPSWLTQKLGQLLAFTAVLPS